MPRLPAALAKIGGAADADHHSVASRAYRTVHFASQQCAVTMSCSHVMHVKKKEAPQTEDMRFASFESPTERQSGVRLAVLARFRIQEDSDESRCL